MIRNAKTLIPALAAMILFAGLGGCAERTSPSEELAVENNTGLPVNSPDVVQPSHWADFTIDANNYKTVTTGTGHYHSDMKNELRACNKHSEGAIELAAWNSFATLVNQIVKSTPLATPRCADISNESRFRNDGILEVKYNPGETPATGKVRRLVELKNNQICSYIASQSLSDTLMQQVEQTIEMTAKAALQQGCANR